MGELNRAGLRKVQKDHEAAAAEVVRLYEIKARGLEAEFGEVSIVVKLTDDPAMSDDAVEITGGNVITFAQALAMARWILSKE